MGLALKTLQINKHVGVQVLVQHVVLHCAVAKKTLCCWIYRNKSLEKRLLLVIFIKLTDEDIPRNRLLLLRKCDRSSDMVRWKGGTMGHICICRRKIFWLAHDINF